VYDGIKIECEVTDRHKWTQSLRLIGKHVEASGEIVPFSSECQVAGCTFSRVPTTLGAKYYFQGSLHKYFKHGGENNDNYTLADVRRTIDRLQQNHAIDPAKSKVLNFEFGVNIELPAGIQASDFQKYLVSAYTKAFEKLNPRRPAVGYIAEFHEYSIKVYDKGYQARTGETGLLRVEIKVMRTRWLDQFGFKKKKADLYITDLLRKENIKILGDILENKVRSLILTPREVDKSKLSPKQRETFAECKDARSWEEWSSKQRQRKKEQLARIFKKLNQPDPVDVLARLVVAKWNELTTEKVPPRQPKAREKATFSTLIVAGIRDILRFILNSHQTETIRKFTVYSPRGTPLPRPPTPSQITGFTRWIDLQGRSPPKYNGL